MKKSVTALLPFVAMVLLLTASTAFAQTAAASHPTSEQSLEALVNEVRQLRAALQRANLAIYRSQVLLERMRFEQEQVSRLSRELNDTRDALMETRARLPKLKEMVNHSPPELKRA